MSLTLAIQAFAVIAPAEASNQCSDNDIIRCGFRSQNEAVQRCNNNTQGFRTILSYYGVSCAQLASARSQTVGATAEGNQLYSMGRNPYNKPGEYGVDIPGAGHFFLRPLSSWGRNNNYKMLVTQTSDRQPFMIMYDCGNIVIKRGYTPPKKTEPPSKLSIAKSNKPTGSVKPGDIIEYTVAFTNKGGTAALFSVNDELPSQLEFVSSSHGNWIFERNGRNLRWSNNTPPLYTFGNTDAFGTPGFIKIRARVKQGVATGTTICNKAWLVDYNPNTKQFKTWNKVTVCNKVKVECPPNMIPNEKGDCIPPPTPEDKTPILAIEKKASNLTQRIDDANGTIAQPGDVIEYKLTTTNFGEAESKDTILTPEKIADILEYATLDLNSLDGGVYQEDTQTIAWNKPVTIKPKEKVVKAFRVTIKNPLPQTPTPAGNPGSYDLILTNVYGNTVEIHLPPTITKTTEQVTQTLPNTGPGEALFIGTTLTVVVGYFFARSRLMAKEMELIKQEYATGS